MPQYQNGMWTSHHHDVTLNGRPYPAYRYNTTSLFSYIPPYSNIPLSVLPSNIPKMKHQPPKVEDYNSEDATPNPAPAEKRKRGSKEYKQTQEQTPEIETQQPPSKAAKSEAPAEDRDAEPEEQEDNVEAGQDGEDDKDFEGEENKDEQGEEEEQSNIDEPKVHKVIEEFGRALLDRTPLGQETLTAAPETLLAMAIDAMLKSRPISHDLTQRAVSKMIEVGYHEIQTLGKSSWDERTMVLKDGGYNRYREQGATNLGDLAELVDGKYGMFNPCVEPK